MFATLGLLQANCAAVRLLLENSVWVSVIQSRMVYERMSLQDARWCKCFRTVSYNIQFTSNNHTYGYALACASSPHKAEPNDRCLALDNGELGASISPCSYCEFASSETEWHGPREVPSAISVVLQLGAVSWTLAGGTLRIRWQWVCRSLVSL